MVYRPKWKIVLELLERTLWDGVVLKWAPADEAYGSAIEFRDGGEALGLVYVVEIPSILVGWTQPPKIDQVGTALESGYMSRVRRLAADVKQARPVSELWQRGGPSWESWRIKETEKSPSVWEVRETDFYPILGDCPMEVVRLVIEREVFTGEGNTFYPMRRERFRWEMCCM